MNYNQDMKNVKNIERKALAAGFEHYSDFAHPDKIEFPNVNILTLTATKGSYNGDVLDVWYNYRNGEIINISIYSQFPNQKAKFKG